MKTGEKVSALFGGALGALTAALLVDYSFTTSHWWLAAPIAAFTGAAGGAFGQSFIEGLVAAAMCGATVALVLWTPFDFPLIKEIIVSFATGSGIGWFMHGIASLYV